MRHNLTATGLSLSQASSISNLCYQRTQEITNKLNGINNATRTFKIAGETYTEVVGKEIPANIHDLLLEKARLHSTQAFLMTNIKAKDELLKGLKSKSFTTKLEYPEAPEFKTHTNIPHVDENWGWDQLTQEEFSEYLEAEAHAAHLGQFIHKDGVLDKLRRELPTTKALDWITIKVGERTPVKVATHHTAEDLLAHHEKIAASHRGFEQRVNYFKAKVKNLITDENARISKENAVTQAGLAKINEDLSSDYQVLVKAYTDKLKVEREEFEAVRLGDIKLTSALRISVDARFQPVVDIFMKDLQPES